MFLRVKHIAWLVHYETILVLFCVHMTTAEYLVLVFNLLNLPKIDLKLS